MSIEHITAPLADKGNYAHVSLEAHTNFKHITYGN